MLENVIIETTSFLIGNSPSHLELHTPNNNTLMKFNLLLSQPHPVHIPNAKAKEIRDSKVAINNRLLIAQEGITLINELNTLQNKNGKINFFINFHFGKMPIDLQTGKPRIASGFVDISEDQSETRMKTDIPIYIAYIDDSNGFNYPVEENFMLKKGFIDMGSSRISLTIFHELLHVWFFRTYLDPEFSGHSGGDLESDIEYEPHFISRIRRFREQIAIIEKALSKKQ